jgi:hypothetical protein
VQQKCSNETPAVAVQDAVEIEFRIALLPPISRGAHLAGPQLHAERLIEIWKADSEVPLGEAFRLLDVETVERVILRTVVAGDYDEGDPRHWHFPPFSNLLPSLREAAWQEILAGTFVLEAIKGITGRRYRPLVPALLPRLAPDWELSRLTRDGRDEYIEVRVRPMPAADIPWPWRQKKPSRDELKDAVEDAAEAYSSEDPPLFDEFWAAVKIRAPRTTQIQMRKALKEQVPHLHRARGQTRKMKSSG